MHGDGLAKLGPKMEAGGVVVRNVSTAPVPPGWEGVRDVAVPATDIAKTLGQPLGASMVALGAFAGASGLVRIESLVAALTSVLPPHRRKHLAANAACIERGATAWG